MRMKRSQNQFLWLKVPNKSRKQRCAPYFKLVYSSLVVTCNIICMVFIPRDDFRQMDFETCNFYKFRPALFLILRLNFEVIIVTFEVVIFSMFCTWTGVVLMNSNRSKKAHRSLDHRAKIKAGAICLVSLETFNIEISFENYARITECGKLTFQGIVPTSHSTSQSVHSKKWHLPPDTMIFLRLKISDAFELKSSKHWLNDVRGISCIRVSMSEGALCDSD